MDLNNIYVTKNSSTQILDFFAKLCKSWTRMCVGLPARAHQSYVYSLRTLRGAGEASATLKCCQQLLLILVIYAVR